MGGKKIKIKVTGMKGNISTKTYKERKMVATTDSGNYVGKVEFGVPKRGKHIDIQGIMVEKQYRRKGVAKQLMTQVSKFAQRIDKKFLRSNDLQSPAMAKIRSKLQKPYKAGNKRKSGSRYFADQFGLYGEQTKRISYQEAIRIMKENNSPVSTGRQVSVTTMIKKRKK